MKRLSLMTVCLSVVLSSQGCLEEVFIPPSPTPTPGVRSGAPTSAGLIDEARRSGRLDEKTAALYELYAMFAPRRLPPAFVGTLPQVQPAHSVTPMLVARAHLSEYSPEERAAVEAMLVAPTDPRYLVFSGEPLRGASGDSCFLIPGPLVQSAPPIDRASSFAAGPTRYFRFIAVAPSMSDAMALRAQIVAALAEPVDNQGALGTHFDTLGAYFDAAYTYFRDVVGMRDVLGSDPTVFPAIAGTSQTLLASGGVRIPVFVISCANAGEENGAAYPDGHINIALRSGFTDHDIRRILMPHEIFHLFEFATAPNLVRSHDEAWPFEAAAVAVEDHLASDVRRWREGAPAGSTVPRWYQGMDRLFLCPEERFYSSPSGSCSLSRGFAAYDGDYSRFLFFKYVGLRSADPSMGFMARFWTGFTSPESTVRALGWEGYLADMQVALLGDVPGRTNFSAGDRAQFATLDLGYTSSQRYTFDVSSRELDGPVSWRVAPTTRITALASMRFHATGASALKASGTHRWLIEVPMAAQRTPFEMDVVARSASGAPLSFTLAPYDGQSINLSAGVSTTTLPGRHVLNTSSGYFLGVITHNGLSTSAAVDYEVGITLRNSCVADCKTHEAAQILARNCCEMRFASIRTSDPAGYARQVMDCVMRSQECARPLCEYLCNADAAAYPPPTRMGQRDIGALVCTAANVARDTPSGLVSLPTWPSGLTCDEMLEGCPSGCPAGMLPIPEGTFQMGSPEGVGHRDEHPQHAEHVSAFCMDRTEVTVAAYRACTGCSAPNTQTGCNWNVAMRDDHPINCVDPAQAIAFCASRSARLPTEAEWEYAARGTDGRSYPWGNDAPASQLCWGGGGISRISTCPVASFPTGNSPFGVQDMAGNVGEWVQDIYAPTYGGTVYPDRRVYRGGSWGAPGSDHVRAAYRDGGSKTPGRYGHLGFRCARGVP